MHNEQCPHTHRVQLTFKPREHKLATCDTCKNMWAACLKSFLLFTTDGLSHCTRLSNIKMLRLTKKILFIANRRSSKETLSEANQIVSTSISLVEQSFLHVQAASSPKMFWAQFSQRVQRCSQRFIGIFQIAPQRTGCLCFDHAWSIFTNSDSCFYFLFLNKNLFLLFNVIDYPFDINA